MLPKVPRARANAELELHKTWAPLTFATLQQKTATTDNVTRKGRRKGAKSSQDPTKSTKLPDHTRRVPKPKQRAASEESTEQPSDDDSSSSDSESDLSSEDDCADVEKDEDGPVQHLPPLSTCANCSTSEEPLKACSRCKFSRYCSTECQTSDWSKHKKASKARANPDLDPFPAISGNYFLHNRSKEQTFDLLLDRLRLRMGDEARTSSERKFRLFIVKAKRVPGFLPPWWDADCLHACLTRARSESKHSLKGNAYAFEIREVWDDEDMPNKLRELAAKVYGDRKGAAAGADSDSDDMYGDDMYDEDFGWDDMGMDSMTGVPYDDMGDSLGEFMMGMRASGW